MALTDDIACMNTSGISPFDCIDDVELIEERATQPISYVLGADNSRFCDENLSLPLCHSLILGGAVKDLTLRYASDWMSGAKKRRVNEEWWQESLRLFVTTDRVRDITVLWANKSTFFRKETKKKTSNCRVSRLNGFKRHE